MKKNIPLYLCTFFLISFNLSFTWPLKDARITSSFGESRGDHFHDGIDLISSESKIYPAIEGDLVFLWDRSIFPTENYPGAGNYRILKHKNGYYSIYMHLKDNASFKKSYSANDIIGKIGNTGHSSGQHLHLSILDINTNRSINPLTIFPKIIDKKTPEIGDAYIRVDDTYFRIRNNDKIRLTKHYPMLLDIWDSMTQMEKLGIFKLIVIFNGEKVTDNDFSEIALLKNGLTISGKSFQDLFDEKGYYKASNLKYNEGINNLLITAIDYSGNTTSKTISFTVNLDMQ